MFQNKQNKKKKERDKIKNNWKYDIHSQFIKKKREKIQEKNKKWKKIPK